MHKTAFWAGMVAAGAIPGLATAGDDLASRPHQQVVARGNADAGAGRYTQALQAARSNRNTEALALLEALLKDYPDNLRYRFDYIAIASWDGKNQDAVDAARSLPTSDMPIYVLSALARAARNIGQYDTALTLYAELQAKQPANPDPAVGQIHTLIDAGRASDALALARPLAKKWPENKDVLGALVRSYDHTGRWMEALETAQELLQKSPGEPIVGRLQFRALWRLGAPHAAERMAPPDMTAEEKAALQHDKLAFELRWARIAAEDVKNPERWQQMDRVIQNMEALAQSLDTDSTRELARQVRFDQVAALTDRMRMSDSIANYDPLAADNPPQYVQLAYAQAQLYQEHPDQARELFAQILKESPEIQLDSRLAYFYSLLESERYDAALDYIDSQNLGEWVDADKPELRRANSDFPRLQVIGALARSYTDQLAEGQARLEDLQRRAPASIDINSGLAATYQMRGWPLRAEAHHLWLLGANPDYAWSRLALYENHLALADFPRAEADLQAAQAALPEEKAVAKAERSWETHNLNELRVESEFGRSDGSGTSPLGTRDRTINAWLYSSPLQYHWRAFAHTHYATADFSDDSPVRTATGTGLEYSQRHWSGRGEIYALRGDGAGVALSSAYQPDDYWRFDASYANKTLDAPLRAYAAGVDARSLNLGANYRWHESRSAHLGAESMDFSDGNQRHAWSAAWTERVVTGPIYKLDLRLDFYTSSNSLAANQVAYFSPSRDRSADLTLINEWTQIRRYERTLKHRLELGLGSYWQEGYQTGGISQLRYEVAYAPDDRLELRLGIGRTRRPYDGVQTTLDALTLMADWRF